MRPTPAITLTLVLAATAALAHTGVKDPQVKARMDGMVTMAADLKTLGQMAKGVTPYDTASAEAALVSLKAEAARIPALFALRAHDPKSEATSDIWTDQNGFTGRTVKMRAVLDKADVGSPEAIRVSLRSIGGACSACHKDYRAKR